jgi:hypothetical protein
VGVRVSYRLARFPAGVEDDAVPAVTYTLGYRDLMRLARHLSQEPVAGRGERGEIRNVFLRYDENMRGSLRAYVPESN